MSRPDRPTYRFADFEFDPSECRLRRGEEERHLRPQDVRVLVYLLEHRDRVVTKVELISHIWETTAVTPDALVQCVSDLRDALGDDFRRPRFIKTVPKIGYRFIGPADSPAATTNAELTEEITSVEIEFEEEEEMPVRAAHGAPLKRPLALAPRRRFEHGPALIALALLLFVTGGSVLYLGREEPAASDPRHAAPFAPRVAGKRAVAVMHFENLSRSTEFDWLREGLPDMLITELSRSRKITVLGRQQMHQLLERGGHDPRGSIGLDDALQLARRGQAEVVALGGFALLDGKVRVDVQLYDARNGQMLTAERLVAEQPSQLLTQVGILSLKLASHLSGPPGAEESVGAAGGLMTDNLQAYRFYSLGVEKAQTLLYVEAVELLEKAVALDPDFAMAHARIGYTYVMCWNRPDEGKPHLERAFQLSARLTEQDRLAILAWYEVANRNYPKAIELYREIIARNPLEVESYWRLARLMRGEERMEESTEIAKQGLAVDPEAKDLYNTLGVTYSEMGRHDEAIATLRRYIELAPNDPNIYDSLGMAYHWAGRYPEAIETLEKALALNPRFEIAAIHLGNTYASMGRYREALREYERFNRVASFVAHRTRGYDSMTVVHLKRGELKEAARAARATSEHDRLSVGPSLLVALERRDLATAAKLMEVVEANSSTDRGNRGYERMRAYYRGLFALRSGRADEAVEHFKRAVKHRPLHWYVDAYEDCLAAAYLELGRIDEAVAEYERILRLNPNYPLAHYRLAQAYERKGDAARARDLYARFLKVWEGADANLVEVVHARRLLSE